MTPPRHTASVPVFQRYLGRLGQWVDLAAPANGPSLLDARLAPDMLPFHLQVTVAANFALRTCFPLAGLPVPAYGDQPPTAAGLHDRLARAAALVGALEPARFAPDRTVEDTAGEAHLRLPADEFLHQYALPNFFFHTGAAYHILRHHGAPVGKALFDGYHQYR